MESRTKAKLSPARVDDIVKHTCGFCNILALNEMADSWFNRVYHLSLDRTPREVV